MDKKIFQKEKKRVDKVIEKWKWIIHRYGFNFTTYYCENSYEFPDGMGKDTVACVKMQTEYLQGDLFISLGRTINMSDDDLSYVVCHELTHFLVAVNDNETATTMISRVFVKQDDEIQRLKNK